MRIKTSGRQTSTNTPSDAIVKAQLRTLADPLVAISALVRKGKKTRAENEIRPATEKKKSDKFNNLYRK
jgi:hypothetical protein